MIWMFVHGNKTKEASVNLQRLLCFESKQSVDCSLNLPSEFCSARSLCLFSADPPDTPQHAVTRCCFLLKSTDVSSVGLLRQDAAAGQTFSHIDFRGGRMFYWAAATRSDPSVALLIIVYSLALLLWSTFRFYSLESHESEPDVWRFEYFHRLLRASLMLISWQSWIIYKCKQKSISWRETGSLIWCEVRRLQQPLMALMTELYKDAAQKNVPVRFLYLLTFCLTGSVTAGLALLFRFVSGAQHQCLWPF